MIDQKEDLIEFATLMCVYIGLFIFMAFIFSQAREYFKNDNLSNLPTISNNNGLRGASRCNQRNF